MSPHSALMLKPAGRPTAQAERGWATRPEAAKDRAAGNQEPCPSTARTGSRPPTFAGAARLLGELAGVRLTVKRVERAAEASGAAVAAAGRERAALIAARKGELPLVGVDASDGGGIPCMG